MSSNFNKIFTSDAYSCKTLYILQLFEQKKKTVFVAHFHKFFWSRPLINAPNFAPNERPYSPYITPEGNSFDSNFREVSVIFISITFVVVKLKISKFCIPIQHSRKSPFWGGFWAFTPPIWSNIDDVLTKGSTLASKNTVWNFFWRIPVLMEKGRTQS